MFGGTEWSWNAIRLGRGPPLSASSPASLHRPMSTPPFARFLLLVLLPAPAFGQGETVYVTTTSDVSDFGGAQLVGNLPGPDGKVSMREALTAANNTPGPQTIGFHIPLSDWGLGGTTWPVVRNEDPPFLVTDHETTIDGSTQTAFTGDTNPNGPEVSFYGYVPAAASPMFLVNSDRNRFLALGWMQMCGYGIQLSDGADENVVQGCDIDKPLYAAVRIIGDDNLIGGSAAGQGNELSSGNDGVRIESAFGTGVPEGNAVLGNFLTGYWNGVQIRAGATGNRIGGLAPGEGNRIAEAGHFGEHSFPEGRLVTIQSPGNLVLGNLIGTDASGTAPANNTAGIGIEVTSPGNVIRGNVIGGLTGTKGAQTAIVLSSGADFNVVQGNWIGVDASGEHPIASHVGISTSVLLASSPKPSGNRIGGDGPGEANVIAHNLFGGVRVFAGTANTLARNELRDNHAAGFLGIDLGGDGPTANDPGDADAGPNTLLNYPVLLSAVASGQGTVVTGQLDVPAPAQATVELFSNPFPAFGEIVEAARFLGTATPGAGGTFVAHLEDSAAGLVLTATATDAAGNTSEISPPVVVVPSPWKDLGLGLAGVHGVPELAGGGPLTAGSATSLLLSDALASAPAFFVVGASAVNLPLFGGTLVPSPHMVKPVVTDASGAAALAGVPWPSGASGGQIYAQAWILDPAAPAGVAASNALAGLAP
jgi:hypothetical protein